MAKSPVVTGISPKEGPPGTRVIIRGENLGFNPNDIISNSIQLFLNETFRQFILIFRFENMRL